jgi:bacteriocin biosynthesis cyclodehydratase domain-containing protein
VSKISYTLSPQWRINQATNALVISGGADARYEIELEEAETSFFPDLQHGVRFTENELSDSDRIVLEQLLTAEVIVPVLPRQSKKLRIALIGDIDGLVLESEKFLVVSSLRQRPDVLLIVRAYGTYAGFLTGIAYDKIEKPHLFIDLAYHHTVSIGPLVFPGRTACVACLQGRIASRWGDDEPPALAAVQKHLPLIASLITVELEKLADGDTSLTNRTVAWDLQDRAINDNQLLKLPLCPVCKDKQLDLPGNFALPWA